MKPWVWLFLVIALCACGQERPSADHAGARPPDVKLPLLEPDPTRSGVLDKRVELVFEEHHWAAGSATPVISQLVLRCSLDEEFHAQGVWGVRMFSFTGIVRSDKNPACVAVRVDYQTVLTRGPEQTRMSGHTSCRLMPEVREQLGANFISEIGTTHRQLRPMDHLPSNATTETDRAVIVVWFRPHVEPASPPIPAIFQTP